MKIHKVQTINEYKTVQKEHINQWIRERFYPGCVTWEMQDASHIKITDATGDSMTISLDEID